MKQDGWKTLRLLFLSAVCFCLSLETPLPASADARQMPDGQKATVKGVIISGSGDRINIQEKKSGALVVLKLDGSTRIQRDKAFFRHTLVNQTALVPGLAIEAKGIGNAKGQFQATKITFTPDPFAVDFAEKQKVYVYLQQRLGKVQPR